MYCFPFPHPCSLLFCILRNTVATENGKGGRAECFRALALNEQAQRTARRKTVRNIVFSERFTFQSLKRHETTRHDRIGTAPAGKLTLTHLSLRALDNVVFSAAAPSSPPSRQAACQCTRAADFNFELRERDRDRDLEVSRSLGSSLSPSLDAKFH